MRIILHAVTVAAGLLGIGGFFSNYFWACDIACHFRVQYALVLALCIAMYCLMRRWRWTLISCILFMINLLPIIPLYMSANGAVASSAVKNVSLLLLNVHMSNTEYARAATYIAEQDADMVALAEINTDWFNALSEVLEAYPYREYELLDNNFGIGLFSKIPPDRTNIFYSKASGFPSVHAIFTLGATPISLVFTHPVSPVNELCWEQRNAQLEELCRMRPEWHKNFILIGDFNTTSWSYIFSYLTTSLQLRDSRRGRGIQPSWRYPSLLSAPIDHVLVSKRIAVKERHIGPDIGSDHRPVFCILSIPAE